MMPSKPNFEVRTFLAKFGKGRKILIVRKKHKIYTQGAPSDSLFYIQKGKVKLTVISKAGKEATIAILNASDFFAEGGLTGQTYRIGSAEAVEDCELMKRTWLINISIPVKRGWLAYSCFWRGSVRKGNPKGP
jgi:CRP/FNR family cyclic AMP-dependent transcriptional regulator